MQVGDRVKVKKSYTDEWASSTRSHISKMPKTAYNGMIGKVVHISGSRRSADRLYDVVFEDGQRWCYEREDLELLS